MNIKVSEHKNLLVEDFVTIESDSDDFNLESGELPTSKKYVLKAILKNKADKNLTDLKYDLRFYDENHKLLNIERNKFISDDEIPLGEDLVIFLPYDLPENCQKVIFSSRANREFKIWRSITFTFFIFFIALLAAGKVLKMLA